MSTRNQGKIIVIEVDEASDTGSVRPSTAPSTASTRRSSAKSDSLNIMQQKQRRRPRTGVRREATPYQWPGKMSQSQHRNGPSIGFAQSTREQYEKINFPKSTSSNVGPGSFQFPTSIQRQVESIKRNPSTITSLRTKSKRKTPLENCALGYVESPGPQVFVPINTGLQTRCALCKLHPRQQLANEVQSRRPVKWHHYLASRRILHKSVAGQKHSEKYCVPHGSCTAS